MANVARLQRQMNRPRRAIIACRDMKFVRRDESELPAVVAVVAILPPPLMADYGNEQRLISLARRHWRRLNFPQRPRGDENQEEDDHRRRRGPGDFDRLAAVDLGRFASSVVLAAAKLPDRVEENPLDDQKNDANDRQRENRQVDDPASLRRRGREDRYVGHPSVDGCH